MLLRNVFFFFHMIGLVMLAGAIIGGAVVERGLIAQLRSGASGLSHAVPLLEYSGRLGEFAKYGGILMLITGAGMLWATHWIFWGQTWLSIKLVLYVLIAVDGAVGIAGTLRKLQGALTPLAARTGDGGAAAVALSPEVEGILGRLKMFQMADYILFIAIILLAVFKP